jgi:hypothetical protein
MIRTRRMWRRRASSTSTLPLLLPTTTGAVTVGGLDLDLKFEAHVAMSESATDEVPVVCLA